MMQQRTGNRLWTDLHNLSATVNFTKARKKQLFIHWMAEVEFFLTCKTCFKKLERFIKKWPPDYGEGFHLWGLCLHDFVNKELGKPLFYPQLTLAPLTEKGIIQ